MIKRYYSDSIPCASFTIRYNTDGAAHDYFILLNKQWMDKQKKTIRPHPLFTPKYVIRHEICHFLQYKRGWFNYITDNTKSKDIVMMFLLELHANVVASRKFPVWQRIIYIVDMIDLALISTRYFINQTFSNVSFETNQIRC